MQEGTGRSINRQARAGHPENLGFWIGRSTVRCRASCRGALQPQRPHLGHKGRHADARPGPLPRHHLVQHHTIAAGGRDGTKRMRGQMGTPTLRFLQQAPHGALRGPKGTRR